MISGHSLRPCILAAFATIILASLAWGSTENVLYTFQGEADGGRPYGLPTFDATGNLYGTASGGGAYGHGVVFELTNNAGVWNYSVLYSFRGADSLSGPDGDAPMGPVTFDRAGNIYGTTSAGGSYRCGTVYELSLVDGRWVESVLHSFTGNGKDGCGPVSGVVLDAAGNIYGTAMWGGTTGGVCGSDGCGAVFKLKAVPGKPRKMVVLHTFKGGNDGGNPQAGLTLDAAGRLYGTAMGYGHQGFGTVYEISSGMFRLLHTFHSVNDGANPAAGLVFDAAGNAYGSTVSGGGSDGSANGTIYQLIPTPAGLWKFNLLYTFSGDNTGGMQYNFALDSNGNLYGTAGLGLGSGDGEGIFQMSPAASSGWNWSVVYGFPSAANGAWPQGVILDSKGNFFGTANGGGASSEGVVFEIAP